MMSEEILNEAKVKLTTQEISNAQMASRGKVNETHFARVLNGGEHVSAEAKESHDIHASHIGSAQTKIQQDRAEIMAKEYVTSAKKQHGYRGKIVKVFHTGKSGVAKETGLDVEHSHPADIVVQWSGHKTKGHTLFHGISAKSNKEDVVNRIKTRSAEKIGNAVGVDLKKHHVDRSNRFARKHGIHDLPMVHRKKKIKNSPKLKAEANLKGVESTIQTRDMYHAALGKLSHKQVIHHINTEFFGTGKIEKSLPYVLASGQGVKGGSGKEALSAKITKPSDSTHFHLLQASSRISFVPTGTSKVNVYAHGKGYEDGVHVIGLETKHDRQSLASNQMIMGREGTLKNKTQAKGEPRINPNLDSVISGITNKSTRKKTNK